MSKTVKTPKFPKNKPGRRIRSLYAYNAFTPFIMKTRGDATNYFRDSLEISDVEKFLREKRLSGMKGLGILHLFVAAYCRVISQKPQLNRYVSGQRIYARKNIEIVMTVKKSMAEEAGETSIKILLTPHDTLSDVYNKMNEAIDHVKNGNETSTGNVANALIRLPRFILRFAIWFLNVLDYFHSLPQSLLDASPFHGTMIITDIGSLGIPPIYHHLYNFGNLPVFLAFGLKRKAYEIDKNGAVVERKYIDYTIVSDERICDGYGYAQCLKMLRMYLKNPAMLDTPPETVVEDIY